MDEIFIYLKNEGTDVWRPVKSQKLSDNLYLILENKDIFDPDNEEWEFIPGQKVLCKEKRFQDGKTGLVAVEEIK